MSLPLLRVMAVLPRPAGTRPWHLPQDGILVEAGGTTLALEARLVATGPVQGLPVAVKLAAAAVAGSTTWVVGGMLVPHPQPPTLPAAIPHGELPVAGVQTNHTHLVVTTTAVWPLLPKQSKL